MDFPFHAARDIIAFVLILVRVSAFLVLFPFFNSRIIPVYAKAGLALLFTVLLYPVVGHEFATPPAALWALGPSVAGEILIGFVLGLMVHVFFEAVRMMGQLVGFQTGFSIANVLDPMSGAQVSILSNLAYWMSMIFFLTLNGHHVMLGALRESFALIRFGAFHLDQTLFETVLEKAADIFVLALKIGAPAIAALLFAKVAFGLITKMIPQMNIMIVAFPVQIVVGLIFFGLSLGVLLHVSEAYVMDLAPLLGKTMGRIGG